MLKVECESCKAPFQIDERRVPPAGLKMRCPKCGHSFLVSKPAEMPPSEGPSRVGLPAVAPRPAVPRPFKPAAPPAPAPPPAEAVSGSAPRTPLPSDFPAALGSLEESDLPVVSAGLPALGKSPAAKPTVGKPPLAPPRAAPPPESSPPTPIEDLDFDLPDVQAGLPAVRPPVPKGPPAKPPPPKRAPAEPDLPVPAVAADLPVVRAPMPAMGRLNQLSDLPMRAPDLPVAAAGLPVIAASLPALADPRANLPIPAAALPVVAANPAVPPAAPTFGEVELPELDDPIPPSASPASSASPDHEGDRLSFGLFGEIDLPHELPPSSSRTKNAPRAASQSEPPEFGDLELDDHRPRPQGPSSAPPQRTVSSDARLAAGGASFGEVDIGGGAEPNGSIGVESFDREDGTTAASTARTGAAASAQVRRRPPVEAAKSAKRSRRRWVVLAAAAVVAVGGAALQLTPYGAFGNLAIGDVIHSADYERATTTAIGDADRALSADTYDAAKAMLNGVYATQAKTPRAHPLAAYTAFIDYATTVRFGADTARVSRAAQLQGALPIDKPVQYADAAAAARLATTGDLAGARSALANASGRLGPADPMHLDVAVLSGEVALAAGDEVAAQSAFKRALALSDGARAHFGLARAADLAGDVVTMKREIEATLTASPNHPGALTLRARSKSGTVDPTQALADLAIVLDGPARAKASPRDLSMAYAAKAWISLERGGTTDAREAFEKAVALDPRNVDALNGQGRLFLSEERSAEALARFDTALGIDPNSPETIANDAEAKMGLERLADAKQQLTEARTRFPKSILILIPLGKVEQHLGNSDAAEADLRAAVALVNPARGDAVLPYVALSKLLSERGHVSDARAALDEAKKKLLPSPALDRAFGEISELQGDYDGAIAHYNAALGKDPKDAATHFHLGVALRRIRKFPEASAELDRVAAVDQNYPGLALERGLLFEESGDVEKAIDQFNGALAKAPDDPDLELRVGSAYVAIGRPEQALPMLHKVLDKRPTSAEANHYIGRALMLEGGAFQGDALRYLKHAVDLDPNRAEFHVYLAWAANDAQPAQLELARDEIDRALALDKLNPEAYWQRGVLERMEGAVDDAVKDEMMSLKLRPSRYEAHATLAECYEDKNDETAALGEWTRAIAGDAERPDVETVRHPYWRFRYGKLLSERSGPAAALAQLLPAMMTAEKISPKPGWLAPLEFLTAEALRKTGKRPEALEHYQRFLEIAPVNSPDRLDAQQAVTALGGRP